MRRIGGGRRQHELGVAGRAERATTSTTIGDHDAAQFDGGVARDHDLGAGLDVVDVATERGAPAVELEFGPVGASRCRPRRGRPDDGAGVVAQVAEAAPGIATRVFAPTRDRDVVPAAEAAAGSRDQHVVAAIGKELDFGHGVRRTRGASTPYARPHDF